MLAEFPLQDNYVKHTWKLVQLDEVKYSVLEISPSKLTSNMDVKWLISEFSRLYKPFSDRVRLEDGKVVITPELDIWWEVCLHKGSIKFYLIVPDRDNIKESLVRQIMKTWKQCNVREIEDYMPKFTPEHTDVTKLSLKYTPILSLDYTKPHYTPLDSFLNAKHHLKDDDFAVLQVGMRPVGNEWNRQAREDFTNM